MTDITVVTVAEAGLTRAGLHRSSSITYISGTGTAGADNTAQTVVSVTLPANTMIQNGDRLRLHAMWAGSTGTAVTGTIKINGVTVSNTTDAGAATWQVNEAWLHYIDATHANIIEVESGALGDLCAANVAGFTWTADQTILISQDQIANNHIVVYALIVDVFPKGG